MTRRLAIDTNAYSALMSGHGGVIAALKGLLKYLFPSPYWASFTMDSGEARNLPRT